MADSLPDFSVAQQVVLTIAPALTATLSIAGSSTIVYAIVWRADRNTNLARVQFRLLLGLCVADIINSLLWVVWSLPIPRGTVGVWGALGNKSTCDFQGFLHQMSASAAIYNGALSHYYFKSIHDSQKDAEFAAKYELRWHIVAIGFPLVTASMGLILDTYAYVDLGCWFGPDPYGCKTDENIPCVRGERAHLYGWMFMGLPLIIMLVFITYCMNGILQTIKKVLRSQEMNAFSTASSETQDFSRDECNASFSSLDEPQEVHCVATSSPAPARAAPPEVRDVPVSSLTLPASEAPELHAGHHEEHQEKPSVPPHPEQSKQRQAPHGQMSSRDANNLSILSAKREAGIQAFLYIGAYVLTHSWSFIVYIINMAGRSQIYFFMFLVNFFWPLQGFANVFIFLRPRIHSIRRRDPDMSYLMALRHAIFHYD